MFRKLLIANRGEIACRVARTSHRMGIKNVGVYSEVDTNALHTSMCDQAYLIGPGAPQLSYLVHDHYLEVAKNSKADSLHPGYGFLSENADFVEELEKRKITFVGPSADSIRKMGSKAESKRIMENAYVPVVPGYHGENQEPEQLKVEAKKIGYPVMLKATMGGGGKGMRIVRSSGEFMEKLESAKNEAMKGFGNDGMIIEKYIERPRHIEFQIFGDKHGNYVHLFERDCTLQRRHQKIIEEAPSNISPELREQMGEAAKAAAKAVNYYNAGTVEFIFDTDSNKYYFMEMNTRLQVEHPVTEMITGLDLVEWQLKVAAGMKLPITKQSDIKMKGFAAEARIYAEDPQNGFLPQSGQITDLVEPKRTHNSVRIDTGVRKGDHISTFYDPMISKLIVLERDREHAIMKLNRKLEQYKIVGLPTNIKFLRRVLLNEDFIKGDFTTGFIEDNEEKLLKATRELSRSRLGTVALVKVWLETIEFRTKRISDEDPWAIRDNWRMNNRPNRDLTLIDDEGNEQHFLVQYLSEDEFHVFYRNERNHMEPIALNARCSMSPTKENQVLVTDDHHKYLVDFSIDGTTNNVTQLDYEGDPLHIQVQKRPLLYRDENEEAAAASDSAKSPMPGTVVKVFCQPGDEVKAGQSLCSIESMKMEFIVKATHDHIIDRVDIKAGQFVQQKEKLITFK